MTIPPIGNDEDIPGMQVAALQGIEESLERMANIAAKFDARFQAAKQSADVIFAKLESLLAEDPEWPAKLGQKFAQAVTLGMLFRQPPSDDT